MSRRDTIPPILILAFNRPDTLRRLIKVLRPLAPPVIYCSQDGPRPHNVRDKGKCKEVQNVWGEIDWKCELHFLIRKKNLGCQKGVSQAISWFFETETAGIILEDDCLPESSFFAYCSEMLKKYENDERIMHVSGNNFNPKVDTGYRFSMYPHCWGWATWKRAWQKFDVNMSDWPTLKTNNWLNSRFPRFISRLFWTRMFDGVYSKKIDSWAIPWVYTLWTNEASSILPNVNLVTNIGFGKESTHTPDPNSPLGNIPTHSMHFPISHPRILIRNSVADSFDQRFVYEQRTLKQLLIRLKSLL